MKMCVMFLLVFVSLVGCKNKKPSANTKNNTTNNVTVKKVLSDKEIEELAGNTAITLNNLENIDVDSLFVVLVDYFTLKGYRCEGYSEGIGAKLYDMFYKNDSIGVLFDNYMNIHKVDSLLQDSIRVRIMWMIEGEYYIEHNKFAPLEDKIKNFPYFYRHDAIKNPDSLYYEGYFE